MKIAALTMVYRDHWALSRWYAHNAVQLGAQNLYVIAHGSDPALPALCPGASIVTIPRDDLSQFDQRRGRVMDGIAAGLLQVYDWVLRSDADEVICFDPALFASLPEAIAAHADAPVLSALGFDVVELEGDGALDGSTLGARRNIAFSGHYSKAVATRKPVPFALHGVRVAPSRADRFPHCLPEGLYLAHLKYANAEALAETTPVRMAVGNTDAPGMPGAGWKAADADARTFLDGFVAKPLIAWDKARSKAYTALSAKPARKDNGIVKTRALKMPFRTRLPERFSGQG